MKLFINTLLPVLMATAVHALAEDSETFERNVDMVAVASQEKAILELTALLRENKKPDEEADLLFRLAELPQDLASIRFRIAYGKGGGEKKPDTSEVNTTHHETITTLNSLISRYPSFTKIQKAYTMRGTSLQYRYKESPIL